MAIFGVRATLCKFIILMCLKAFDNLVYSNRETTSVRITNVFEFEHLCCNQVTLVAV